MQEGRLIVRMKRFKIRMFVVITAGAFSTFTMLLYMITSESAICNSATSMLCFYVYREEDSVSKNGSHKFPGEHHRLHKKGATMLISNAATPMGRFENATGESLRTRRNSRFEGNSGNSTGFPTSPVDVSENYVLIKSDSINVSKVKMSWRYIFDRYTDRQRILETGCRKLYNASHVINLSKLKMDHILVDETRKILFCYVPKVACTNWKRIFLFLTGKANNISEAIRIPSREVHTRSLFTSLQNYTIPEMNRILRDYTKFIFVRNPFERLLSAYRNKLEQHYDSSKYFQSRFGKFIVRKFRKNPSNASLERGDDVTFAEFVSYLIASDPHSYNEHWQTATSLCHPCLVRYDMIGKYETLISDSNFVLEFLKLNFTFPILDKPSRTASSLNKYYTTLTREVIYKLYSIYEMDFKLFGYDFYKTLNWLNDL